MPAVLLQYLHCVRRVCCLRLEGMVVMILMIVPASSPAQDSVRSTMTGLPVFDSTMLPGWRNFIAYNTPGLCIQAAQDAERIATRSIFDTTTYPYRDTLSSSAVATAKRCAARFTIDNVSASDLLDFACLTLMTQDDAKAAAIADRYVAAIRDPVQRRWALASIGAMYLAAKPARIVAATAIAARLDSLGPPAALQRIMLREKLQQLASRAPYTDGTPIEREALAALTAYAQLSASDREDILASGETGAVLSIFFVELIRSMPTALARTKELVSATGYPHLDWFDQILQMMHAPQYFQLIGTVAPPLTASYWIDDRGVRPVQVSPSGTRVGPDSQTAHWPGPGKLSIYLRSDVPMSPPMAAMWRRLLSKYGSAISMTIMTKTNGYFRDGPPLSPPEEAARLGKFYQEELELPVTVAVDASSVRTLSDGRRLMGPAPYENDPYYSGFLVADQTGKILLAAPGLIFDEPLFDAWLARAINSSH
jgi:hypothetical protein